MKLEKEKLSNFSELYWVFKFYFLYIKISLDNLCQLKMYFDSIKYDKIFSKVHINLSKLQARCTCNYMHYSQFHLTVSEPLFASQWIVQSLWKVWAVAKWMHYYTMITTICHEVIHLPLLWLIASIIHLLGCVLKTTFYFQHAQNQNCRWKILPN